MSGRARWIIGVVVAVIVAVPLGTYVFIHFIEDDAPAPLTIDSSDPGGSSAPLSVGIAGTWRPTSESIVGYRVNEVLFGQTHVAVGRTSKVQGTLSVDGTTVTAAQLTVDMTSVSSDQQRRDNQFHGRIMQTAAFPTAVFELTDPIQLAAVPSNDTPISVTGKGKLTLHGTTRVVTVPLKAARSGSNFVVTGTIPIAFADYGIPNPSFASVVTTEDHGILELKIVFARA